MRVHHDELSCKGQHGPPVNSSAFGPIPVPATVDAEAVIRSVIGKLRTQGNAEAERLCQTMRRVIATL